MIPVHPVIECLASVIAPIGQFFRVGVGPSLRQQTEKRTPAGTGGTKAPIPERHLDARATTVRIGKIRDPTADPECIANLMHLEFSVERGGALEKPQPTSASPHSDADREPEQHGTGVELDPVGEDLGVPNRIGPDTWSLLTLGHGSACARARLWLAGGPWESCCARAQRPGIGG